MTTKQKQCLLCYLGYYQGAIDGIWGPQSIAATRNLQKACALAANGTFGPETESKILEVICTPESDWWQEITFFNRTEFACKCGRYCDGFPVEPERRLIQVADRVRRHFGAPVIVSSGVRCPTHNANVGGVANSRHISGKAMDFCVKGKSASQVLAYVRGQPEIRYAYAIDSQFVHMDID